MNMYKIAFVFIVFLTVGNLSYAQSDLASSDGGDTIEYLNFKKMSYDLGEVKRGDVLFFDIEFKNISKIPIMIDFVSSCDCTEVDYPLDEIMPGEVGVLKVKFDSKDKTESETTDIDVFLKKKDSEGSQIYYTLEYSFELIK